jgi:hypothetical protein
MKILIILLILSSCKQSNIESKQTNVTDVI